MKQTTDVGTLVLTHALASIILPQFQQPAELRRRADKTMQLADRYNVPIREVAAILQPVWGPGGYLWIPATDVSNHDWTLMPVQNDPMYGRGRMPMPGRVVERLRAIDRAGIKFDEIWIAHEMDERFSGGTLRPVDVFPSAVKARPRFFGLGATVRILAGAVGLSSKVGAAVGSMTASSMFQTSRYEEHVPPAQKTQAVQVESPRVVSRPTEETTPVPAPQRKVEASQAPAPPVFKPFVQPEPEAQKTVERPVVEFIEDEPEEIVQAPCCPDFYGNEKWKNVMYSLGDMLEDNAKHPDRLCPMPLDEYSRWREGGIWERQEWVEAREEEVRRGRVARPNEWLSGWTSAKGVTVEPRDFRECVDLLPGVDSRAKPDDLPSGYSQQWVNKEVALALFFHRNAYPNHSHMTWNNKNVSFAIRGQRTRYSCSENDYPSSFDPILFGVNRFEGIVHLTYIDHWYV